jgi:hypothetical protein
VKFGKHKGKKWTRVPVGYLTWMVNSLDGEKYDIAKAELERRGTTIPTELVLSGHSIDRASQVTSIHEWLDCGVYSWLTVIANEALERANGDDDIIFKGFKFCFTYGNNYPTLKTIIKIKLNNDKHDL